MERPAPEKITDEMTMELTRGFEALVEVLKALCPPEGGH
jgi:hypothetical protein